MKTTAQLNTFAVGLPLLILLTYPIAKEGAFFYALLSTLITGFIQVLMGVKLIFEEPRNRYIQIYIGGVILFFLLCFVQVEIYNDALKIALLSMPPLLAIYLSVIIYKKAYK